MIEDQLALVHCIMLTSACLFLPLRSCVLWVIPALILGPYNILVLLVGSKDKYITVTCLFIMTILLFVGARRSEKDRRQKWLTVRNQEKEIEASAAFGASMHAVAEAFCDIVIKLDANFCVCGLDRKQRSFFNQEMDGCSFVRLLAEDDKARFFQLADQADAATVPGFLQVTLRISQSTLDASLLLVHTNQGQVHYVLGISIQKSDHSEAFQLQESIPVPTQGHVQPLPLGRLSAPSEHATDLPGGIWDEPAEVEIDHHGRAQQ